ncbi:sigma-70 family RNA polymerase sigma factor [Pseudomonas citronellolis]|uniref:sigma-70 family RNA polymerase sigma factor n=1 Tax=Pseudomonas citronellolis TaxID=53408 RepID=UPI0021C22E4F|nr:sigma-70 family RNA polymerase sigma factor [Pseudomonas citronellolis]UXJ49560.1 sigma-70 family RNA polymerase sigma factor [Pseudomonas citronellolis]
MSVAELPGQQGLHLLYSDHHGWLKGWLHKRLGNAADAADMAHDVFLRLLLKPASRGFSSPVDARAYLCTMARGMCIDLWRRREVEQAWLDTLAAQPEPFEPSPEFRLLVIETILEVGAVLARLSDKAQQAFVMAQIHGLPTREIAAGLAVSERMVQKYLAQAMLQLALVDAGLAH